MIYDVITLKEAVEWGGMTRPALLTKLFYIESRSSMSRMRKSGNIWLLTVDLFLEAVPNPKNERPDYE